VTLLLLIRHAVTDATGSRLTGQRRGFSLSEAGVAQASALAERLRPIPLAALWSSSLERCVETARIVGDGRRLDIRTFPELMDVDYGRWSGRSLRPLYRTTLWRRLQAAPSNVRFPEGETLSEVQGRSLPVLLEAADRYRGKIVAVVTHADVIRLALAHFAGMHVDHFQRLTVSPASVSAVSLGDRVPRILRTNDTGSLDDLLARHAAAKQTPKRTRPAGSA